jgi:hypothetical protein
MTAKPNGDRLVRIGDAMLNATKMRAEHENQDRSRAFVAQRAARQSVRQREQCSLAT